MGEDSRWQCWLQQAARFVGEQQAATSDVGRGKGADRGGGQSALGESEGGGEVETVKKRLIGPSLSSEHFSLEQTRRANDSVDWREEGFREFTVFRGAIQRRRSIVGFGVFVAMADFRCLKARIPRRVRLEWTTRRALPRRMAIFLSQSVPRRASSFFVHSRHWGLCKAIPSRRRRLRTEDMERSNFSAISRSLNRPRR